VTRTFDLCIIGSGSGNMIVDDRFAGWSVALVDSGTFGGTCLNVGCIPTKMLAYPADLADDPRTAAALGVELSLARVDWSALRDRVFSRVDTISQEGERGRRADPHVVVFAAEAKFVGPRRLQVGDETISADRVVLAAGSRVRVPDLPGLADVEFHTSDTVMRLDRLPGAMIIVGGGYVSAEFAHIFSALGSAVTVLNRSDRMLAHQDHDIADRFTREIGTRVDLRLETTVSGLEPLPGGRVRVATTGPSSGSLDADVLLLATGRRPNGDRLDLAAGGVDSDTDGFVMVDDRQRTTADGVFALGDVCSPRMLKHVANHEARVVQHNLLHPDSMIGSDHRHVPQAVFSEPQLASVGLTEDEARARGIPFVVGRADYGETAYGWAMEDTAHFAKVLADPTSGLLLGGHIVGPQASILIQPVVQALSFGTPAAELARGQYWPHPAMSEVVEGALLDLPIV
jgi:mycothione reductase